MLFIKKRIKKVFRSNHTNFQFNRKQKKQQQQAKINEITEKKQRIKNNNKMRFFRVNHNETKTF